MNYYWTGRRWIMMAFLTGSLVASATTVVTKQVVCAECGATNTVHVITSTSSFGPMDLETRPAFPARMNVHHLLQVCSNCGYPSFDLSSGLRTTEAKAYLSKMKRQPRLPELYRHAAALYEREEPGCRKAFECDVLAAWVADDLKDKRFAAICRYSAVVRFRRMKDPDVGLRLMSVELLRRVGDFVAAGKAASVLEKDSSLSAKERELLNYEKRLISASDSAIHTIDEVGAKDK